MLEPSSWHPIKTGFQYPPISYNLSPESLARTYSMFYTWHVSNPLAYDLITQSSVCNPTTFFRPELHLPFWLWPGFFSLTMPGILSLHLRLPVSRYLSVSSVPRELLWFKHLLNLTLAFWVEHKCKGWPWTASWGKLTYTANIRK